MNEPCNVLAGGLDIKTSRRSMALPLKVIWGHRHQVTHDTLLSLDIQQYFLWTVEVAAGLFIIELTQDSARCRGQSLDTHLLTSELFLALVCAVCQGNTAGKCDPFLLVFLCHVLDSMALCCI